uniref:Uncharacterized protein n=1 Tax=Timema monikensis TaxID=170555 RepID=A0A7R9HU45_9NEOP|nr:unnamed protein product [Timema monikensis]
MEKENCRVWWGKQALGTYVVSPISVCGTVAAIQYHSSTIRYNTATIPLLSWHRKCTIITVDPETGVMQTEREPFKTLKGQQHWRRTGGQNGGYCSDLPRGGGPMMQFKFDLLSTLNCV